MSDGIGEQFQEQTKYSPGGLSGAPPDFSAQPELYKEYPASEKIELPADEKISGVSLDDVLRKRKSIRRFSSHALTIDQLAYILWASTGIQRVERGYEFRTAPSAGALYPIETYVVANRVEQVPEGIYHYCIREHHLETIKIGSFGDVISAGALGQDMCAKAAVTIVWTAVFPRTVWKYKQRGYRYIYMDVGHVAENLALAAVALDLGSCQIGALFDDVCNELIEVDGVEESVIYMSAVGHPMR